MAAFLLLDIYCIYKSCTTKSEKYPDFDEETPANGDESTPSDKAKLI